MPMKVLLFLLHYTMARHWKSPMSVNNNTDLNVENLNRRIIGGCPCSILDHPYMVSIRSTVNYEHLCCGTIVSSLWVLTAAHCCPRYYKRGAFTVIAGSSTIIRLHSRESRIQSSLVFRVYPHADYKSMPVNDICLMNLEFPLHKSRCVQFVKLATPVITGKRRVADICTNSTVLGWGYQHAQDYDGTALETPIPPFDFTLQCLQIPVITTELCESMIAVWIPPTIICAFTEGKDGCQGDSGGPLICDGVQYGITSGGRGCAFDHFPGFYTRVHKYDDFIQYVLSSGNDALSVFAYRTLLYLIFVTIPGLVYNLI